MKINWDFVSLGSVTQIYNGNSINAEYKKKHFLGVDKGYPFIATKDVGFNGFIDYENGVKIPFDTDYKIADSDSVFICAEGGSAGKKIGYVTQSVCFGNKLFCIKPKQNILKGKYIYYYLQSVFFQIQFQSLLTGLIGGVSANKFKNISIPVPPLYEQERIVSLLDLEFAKIDAIKANAEKQLQDAKDLFQSALKDLLTPKEGWIGRFIAEISQNLDSKRIPITQNKRIAGIYPYYGASGIVDYVNDYIFDDTLLLISEDGANLLARTTPIAFSITGKNWVNNHAHVLKFNDDYLRRYVEYYFANLNISDLITGAAQPKLTQGALNTIKILYPMESVELQNIVLNLDNLFEKVKQLQSNYEKTIILCNDLKQSILKDIFG